jgi:copper chaperone for superoxide dismutase
MGNNWPQWYTSQIVDQFQVILTEKEDNLGKIPLEVNTDDLSIVDGNSGVGILGGIVARSAGVGQNLKKVCPCDSPSF